MAVAGVRTPSLGPTPLADAPGSSSKGPQGGRELIPVNVITGFLGSGKTSLLRHLLATPEFADCAVLINEFGEIGLDHRLIERVEGDLVLLQSGCICCTIRSDLSETIRALWGRRERGEVMPFRRLAIETTGLADPTPILATIMSETVIRHHFRLGNVVTTVDAVNGAGQRLRQPEWLKQVAVADRLIVTKTDLAEPATLDVLEAELRVINPAAPLFLSANDPPAAVELLGEDIFDAAGKSADVRSWLAAEGIADVGGEGGGGQGALRGLRPLHGLLDGGRRLAGQVLAQGGRHRLPPAVH